MAAQTKLEFFYQGRKEKWLLCIQECLLLVSDLNNCPSLVIIFLILYSYATPLANRICIVSQLCKKLTCELSLFFTPKEERVIF